MSVTGDPADAVGRYRLVVEDSLACRGIAEVAVAPFLLHLRHPDDLPAPANEADERYIRCNGIGAGGEVVLIREAGEAGGRLRLAAGLPVDAFLVPRAPDPAFDLPSDSLRIPGGGSRG